MSVLTVEELLKLPMLICKICHRRLQRPVMQVGMFGNICGVCHERSVLTDVIPNNDVEMLLSKMHVSCNYKGRGCTYDGSYYNTCKHEADCKFRDKICPFAYLGMCDNIPGDFHEIPAHIVSHHEENVLLGKMDSPVQVSNPSETNQDIFYLLRLDEKEFLLRTWIDQKEECIFYAFYYFTNNTVPIDINIFIQLRWQSAIFNVTDEELLVQDESGIKTHYETRNVFSIPIATLRSLNCLEYVAISIDEEEAIFGRDIFGFKGSLCRGCMQDCILYKCIYCSVTRCKKCSLKVDACVNILESHKWNRLCRNAGCGKYINSEEYDHHKSVCFSKNTACPFQSILKCAWRGFVKNMAHHMSDAHSAFININISSLKTTGINFFVKGHSVFEQTLELVNYRELSIRTKKLTEPHWDDSYKWEVRVERKEKAMIMVITDLFTKAGGEKRINVESFVDGDVLTVYTDIKSVDECASSKE